MGPARDLAWTAAALLAWRNLMADKPRLARSASGIAFAVLLMLIELGFNHAFVEASVDLIRQFDADLVIVSTARYQFSARAPFSRRELYEARSVAGVASARPIYADWNNAMWKSPADQSTHLLQVFAFDPDEPVFRMPEVAAHLAELRQPDTLLTDRRARAFVGRGAAGVDSEFARVAVHVVGTFALGPNFATDGTLIMSDRNYLKLLGAEDAPGGLPDPDFGVVKVAPGYDIGAVRTALRAALPGNVDVLTLPELIGREITFQKELSNIAPIFGVGVAVGFIVGMLISYQILYTAVSDQLPQYATLKAIGYGDGFLRLTVLQQAAFCGLLSYGPAWLVAVGLYWALGRLMLLPMRMTVGLALTSMALCIGMCMLSALIAVRRVIRADPAELF